MIVQIFNYISELVQASCQMFQYHVWLAFTAFRASRLAFFSCAKEHIWLESAGGKLACCGSHGSCQKVVSGRIGQVAAAFFDFKQQDLDKGVVYGEHASLGDAKHGLPGTLPSVSQYPTHLQAKPNATFGAWYASFQHALLEVLLSLQPLWLHASCFHCMSANPAGKTPGANEKSCSFARQ